MTFADGTAAPEASETVPLSSAVDCASMTGQRDTDKINSRIIKAIKVLGKILRTF
jgi:hypothetical protein